MHRTLIMLAGCGLLAACGQAPAPVATGPEAAFLKANAVAMDRMMADMDVPPTGDVDRDFARMMIPHHQGGIDMAEALLRYGHNEELKALARSIIAVQQKEIALMHRISGEPVPAAVPAAAPKPHSGTMHHRSR